MNNNYLFTLKLAGLMMVIGGTISLTLNLTNGKPLFLAILNLVVIITGVVLNLKNFSKK